MLVVVFFLEYRVTLWNQGQYEGKEDVSFILAANLVCPGSKVDLIQNDYDGIFSTCLSGKVDSGLKPLTLSQIRGVFYTIFAEVSAFRLQSSLHSVQDLSSGFSLCKKIS